MFSNTKYTLESHSLDLYSLKIHFHPLNSLSERFTLQQGGLLLLILLHHRIIGIYSLQHFFNIPLQPQHHSRVFPQRVTPPDEEGHELIQGRGLPVQTHTISSAFYMILHWYRYRISYWNLTPITWPIQKNEGFATNPLPHKNMFNNKQLTYIIENNPPFTQSPEKIFHIHLPKGAISSTHKRMIAFSCVLNRLCYSEVFGRQTKVL